jgi:hypothetical protein
VDGALLRDPRGEPAAVHDPRRPDAGVRVRFPAGTGELLGIEPPGAARLVDRWLRGGDATSIWESRDGLGMRATAMWRLHAAEAGVRAWELVLSTQTALLSADARLAVTCRVPAAVCGAGPRTTAATIAASASFGGFAGDRVTWSATRPPEAVAALLEPAAAGGPAGWAVLVAGHPREVEGTFVRHDAGMIVVETRLFADGLEKGVLLRGRVLAALGPAGSARAWATRATEAFAATPPLLST